MYRGIYIVLKIYYIITLLIKHSKFYLLVLIYYKNVFVDFSDIAKNNNFEEMKRCMYTAVSRTIENLYILI